MEKFPKWKILRLTGLDPFHGLAALLAVNPTPVGYVFYSMKRTGTTANIRYLREGWNDLETREMVDPFRNRRDYQTTARKTLPSPEEIAMTMQDRRKGALYGQAIGDALGAFYEFSGNLGPGESARYRSSRNDGFLEGEWTDDTEQAFILLRAFTEEPEDQDLAALILAEGLQNWLHNDGRGCGNHTAKVLTDGVYGIAPLVVSEDVWVQSGKESAPNGGVMRAVGVPVVRPWDPAWVIQAATLGCQVTHWDPRCVASAVAVSVACAALIRGEGIPSAVQQGIDAGKAIEPGIAEYLTMSLDKLQLRGPGIGYTYKCAGSGFWALREFQREAAEVEEMTPPGNSAEENWGLQFESILNDIIREQGDTDTNAAVAGAVMGSYIGFENLPKHLVEGLQNKGTLDALLATLPEAP